MPTPTEFRGPLTPAQTAEGILAAVENAKHLITDAELLLANKRWSSAFALAALAIEELGKEEVLRRILIVSHDRQSLSKAWKAYRSHVEKNRLWIVPSLSDSLGENVDDILSAVTDEASPHPQDLDRMKQNAFYTNVYDKGSWASPSDAINQAQAENVIAIAKRLAVSIDSLRTEPALTLYVKHLRPVYGQSVQRIRAAMLDYLKEANAAGILSDEGLNTMKQLSEVG